MALASTRPVPAAERGPFATAASREGMVDSNTLVQLQPDRKEEIHFLQVIYTLGNVTMR